MRFAIGFFLAAMLISGLPGQTELTLTPTRTRPSISRAQALARAQAFTGVSAEFLQRAEYGLATDSTIPFITVKRCPVWQLTFSGMRIAVGTVYYPRRYVVSASSWMYWKSRPVEIYLTDLCILLDASNGSLLRVDAATRFDRLHLLSSYLQPYASPMIARDDIEHTFTGQTSLTPTTAIPERSLLDLLTMTNFSGGISRVQAYFGLYTDTRDSAHPILQRPTWLLLSDGKSYRTKNSDPNLLPANQMEVCDASTGNNLSGNILMACPMQVFFLGGTIDTDDPAMTLVTVNLFNGSDHALTFANAQIGDKEGHHLTIIDLAPFQPIRPGLPSEVQLKINPALIHANRNLFFIDALGHIYHMPLPSMPRQITCTGIERLDQQTFRVTLENAARDDISFTTIDLLPKQTGLAELTIDTAPTITRKEPVTIAVTLPSPPALGSPLWFGLKDAKNRLVASCLVTVPAVNQDHE
jgi:hypothetical protein